jgi:hypothetical protein
MPIQPSQSRHDLPWWREAVRLRRHILSLKAQTRLLRRDLAAKKYNPNQPRVPAGNSDGGQWSSGASGGGGGAPGIDLSSLFGDLVSGLGAAFTPSPVVADVGGTESWASYQDGTRPDGSLAEQAVVNRDGSTIHSEYAAPGKASDWDERHTVTLPDGSKTTFETRDRTQTIRAGGPDGEIVSRVTWTERGPEPEATVQLARGPLRRGTEELSKTTITSALTLYNWLSTQKTLEELQAVASFSSRDFSPTLDELNLSFVGNLTQKEVDDCCKRLRDVLHLTGKAVEAAGPYENYRSPQAYGTAVHTLLKELVEQEKNPNFRAERSFLKSQYEGKPGEIPYGTRDSLRIDVYERRPDGTVCVYDIKTGNAGLTAERAIEIARTVYRRFGNVTRIIVTEVRPR